MLDDAIQLRAMTSADIPVGLSLCRIARWNQVERDWELFLRLTPGDCRVAVKAGQVVGTVTTVSYQNVFSWIGMVLVDPAERRQGIGTKLLNEALNVLKDQPLIGLDATPAGREVYLKLGFVDECRLSRMEAVVSGFSQDENNPARRMAEADLPKVFALDKNVFGADRSLLLQRMFAGARELAWVLLREQRIIGFTFGRHGFNFEQLGPIVAENVQTATHLVMTCLAEQSGKRFLVDAAHHDAEWLRWLESVGFKEQRPFVRMFRGEGRRPGLPEKQFAILGPEFG
ncbi:MAG: GNAT family N-acetyltransferase [Acidobacteria bacterium]|nr:GNAT family N-acetyltransferase [Acidobacteriota bacterium]